MKTSISIKFYDDFLDTVQSYMPNILVGLVDPNFRFVIITASKLFLWIPE